MERRPPAGLLEAILPAYRDGMSTLDRPGVREDLLLGLEAAALAAGREIWKIFETGFDVETKADASPVTIADRAAEAIILDALARLAPGVPVVAEEEAAAGRLPVVDDAFFLVDPLDGTKEFIRKGTDFTVNIGLIQDRAPTLGVVFAPARGELFIGDARLGRALERRDGSPWRPLAVRRPAHEPPVALASRSHDTPAVEAYLCALGVTERISIGSSLKFCLLARGDADLYPRPSPTMEWDTAAGDAVLRAAGGTTFALDGGPFAYAKPDFFNPGFVAVGACHAPPLRPFMPAP